MAKGNSFNALSLLNKKSQKQAEHEREAVEVKKEEFDVVMLDVYDLVPSEDNFYSTKEIEELAVAIEILGGIRQNLEVKPPEHGKYEVTAGHRRRLASIRLVEEGKEKYRFVPCVIRKEETEIMDRLSLILTNSTARDMSDWEKVQQYKELKSTLEEYRKQLEQEEKQARAENKRLCEFCEYHKTNVEGAEEENTCINESVTEDQKVKFCSGGEPGCPFYEKARFGRTREMISELLHLSGTQLSRYEKIDNSLKEEFKQELREGNINVSVAHEIAKKTQEEQEELHEDYKQSGELHIKNVAKKEPQEIAAEQINNVRAVVQEIVKGEVNRAVFSNQNPAAVVKTLKRFFYQSYKGGKVEPENGEQVIYRFSTEGVNIMSKEWENYVVSYESLAEIIVAMIAAGDLFLEPEPVQQEMFNPQPKEEPTEEDPEEPQEETEDTEEFPGQDNILNHPEYLPMEKGLSFSAWLERKEGKGQQDIVADIIRREFIEVQTNSFSELQENIVGAVNGWLATESEAYKEYMKG